MGAQDAPAAAEPFEERFPRLVKQLEEQFAESARLEEAIRRGLASVWHAQ